MTSPIRDQVTVLARGKDFNRSWKLFLDKTAQFGDNGQELFDKIPRKPKVPVKCTTVNADGTWTSLYALRADRMGLSEEGLIDFNFERVQVADALKLWNKNAAKLLQLLLDHLSAESKALLELKKDPLVGYVALRSRMDNLELANMIAETHLGSSNRAKQVSFQELLLWRQTHSVLAVDLAQFRALSASVKLNFTSPSHPGYFPYDVLERMVFLLGLDRSRFQREIENAYDQHASKTTDELMELIQLADMERDHSGTSANFVVPAALVTVEHGSKKRPDLGKYPPGGNKDTTCQFCWSRGFKSTNHGADHLSNKECFFKLRSESRTQGKPRPGSSPLTALVTSTPSMSVVAAQSMSVADAQAFVASYTSAGYAQYIQACKIAGLAYPDLVTLDTPPTALVSIIAPDDLARVLDLPVLPVHVLPTPEIPSPDDADDSVDDFAAAIPEVACVVPAGAVVETAANLEIMRRVQLRMASDVVEPFQTEDWAILQDVTRRFMGGQDPSTFTPYELDLLRGPLRGQVMDAYDRQPLWVYSPYREDRYGHLQAVIALVREVVHDFENENPASLDDSFGSMSVNEDVLHTPCPSVNSDPGSHILHLQQVCASVEAPLAMFSVQAHHLGVTRALEVAASLALRPHVQDGLDMAPNYSFCVSDEISVDSEDEGTPFDPVAARARQSAGTDISIQAESNVLDTDGPPSLMSDSDSDDDVYDSRFSPSALDPAIALRNGHSRPDISSPSIQHERVIREQVRVARDHAIRAGRYRSTAIVVDDSSSEESPFACVGVDQALPGSVFLYDTCSSCHVTNNISSLDNVQSLEKPINLGGIGQGIDLTHQGDLRILAKWPSLSRAYFSATASHNLLSTGLLQRQGFTYASTSPTQTTIYDPSGDVFDVGHVQRNNLLQSSLSASVPDDFVAHYASYAAYTSLLEQHRHPTGPLEACIMSYDERLLRASSAHLTAEQRVRCDRFEDFHQGRGIHYSDDVMAEAIQNGLYPELNLTAQDVRNNRILRGPCLYCSASKFRQQPMPPSQSEPASAVGMHLHVDIFETTKKSPAGKSVAIRCTDDYSGDSQLETALSKRAEHLFAGLVTLIHRRYTVYGHRVSLITSDADPAMEPLIAMFQKMGIVLALVSPGMHEHFIENRIGSQSGKVRAVVNSMEQVLPAQFDVYAEKWILDNANAMPNARSRPSTPDILVTGLRRPVHPNPALRFGVTALVFQSDLKRSHQATALMTSKRMIDASEVGLCLGYYSGVPGDFLFLLDNGQIVPRRNAKVVNVVFTLHGIPLPMRNVLRSSLPPPSPYPDVKLPDVDGAINRMMYDSADVSIPPTVVVSRDGDPLPDERAPSPLPSSSPPPLTPSLLGRTGLSPIFDVRNLVDLNGNVVHRAPSTPVRVPAILSPSSTPFVPTTLSMDTLPMSPLPPTPIVLRRSSRHHKALVADADGFTLVQSKRIGFRLGLTPVPIIAFREQTLRLPAPPLLSSTKFQGSVKRIVRRSDLHEPTKRRPGCSDDSSGDADFAAIQQATLQSKQEFLAMVAVATELIPFALGPEEYVLGDTAPGSALVSCFDMMPADELLPIKDHVAKQLSLSLACRTHSREKLDRVITAEFDKLIRIGGIHDKFYPTRQDLPPDIDESQILAGIFVFKDKSDGRETARLAANGKHCPLPFGQSSFAAVVPMDDKHMTLAGMVAHCNSRNEVLNHSSCDVVGAFPRVSRPPGSIDLYLRLPKNLPHAWAGGYVRIKGAIYGLKESSRLFQQELVKVLQSVGFKPMPESTMTFQAIDKKDSNLMSIASVVVDDVSNLDNCPHLTTLLHEAVKERFQEITIDDGCVFAGIEHEFTVTDGINQPRNSVFSHQNKYINRIARNEGVIHMPPVLALDMPDFYVDSHSPPDLVLADFDVYQRIIGCLVHALQTRAELRPGVSYLSSHNVAPNAGDLSKAIYLLRYAYSTQDVGLVYNARSTQICAYSDSAFAFHSQGQSSTGVLLCMGSQDAPFVCFAKKQSLVAPDIVASEYYAANSACLLILHYRQLATSLGWIQGPTQLFMDSQSAINLAQAPIITKKARHMKARFHFIREQVETKTVILVHIPTSQMRVDVITKIMTPSPFLRGRDMLMNQSLTATQV